MSLPKSERSTGGEQSNKKKLNFLKLTPGSHTIRFMHPISEVMLKHTHWIKGTTIECVDVDTCPVCAVNREILNSVDNDWKSAKKVTGFNPYQKRYYANVLDLTAVKVSPNSERGFENKRDSQGRYPLVCEETGDSLASIAERPSNTVKILNSGVTLFGALDAINDTVGDEGAFHEIVLEDGTVASIAEVVPYGIDTFNITLMVQGVGRERQITPIPQVHKREVYDYEALGVEPYDLERALLTFNPEEVKELLRGVQVRDILTARGNEEDSIDNTSFASVSKEVAEGLAEAQGETLASLEDLFDLD